MTDRSNDALDDDPEQTPSTPPPEGGEVAEEAQDLTDAELEAATEGAVAEVEAEDAGRPVDEADEAELEGGEAEEADEAELEGGEAEEAEAPLPRGARARAEAIRAREREAREEREARRSGGQRRGFRRAREEEPKASARTPFPIDPALRIKDPISTAFVAATILVFLGIFLYAMAFGKKGAFTPERTPRPTPIVTLAPTGSPGPSESPGASGSPAPSGSPVASPAGSPAPTIAPSPTLPTQ